MGQQRKYKIIFRKKHNQKGKLILYCHIRENNGVLSLFYRAPEEGIDWKLEGGIGVAPCCNLSDNKQKIIILPSQDQLQDICRGDTIFDVLDDFRTFIFGILTYSPKGNVIISREIERFGSAEQLWLAFLMHSSLQKRWNGEKWEKI